MRREPTDQLARLGVRTFGKSGVNRQPPQVDGCRREITVKIGVFSITTTSTGAMQQITV